MGDLNEKTGGPVGSEIRIQTVVWVIRGSVYRLHSPKFAIGGGFRDFSTEVPPSSSGNPDFVKDLN